MRRKWLSIAARSPLSTLRSPHNSPPIHRLRQFTTLGIETSCDDTCVSLLRTSPHNSRATLLFNKKTTSDNRRFGGVYPPTALQEHGETLATLVEEALRTCRIAGRGIGGGNDGAGLGGGIDLVAVTRGPGMSRNLAEGLSLAKGLAVAFGVPLVGVNHMQAHALTPRLVDALERGKAENSKGQEEEEGLSPEFPFLTLLVSGGHTQLVHSTALTSHRILINAPAIAIGDSLDKCARLILPPDVVSSNPDVMYGRALETFAFPSASALESYAYVPPRKRGEEVDMYQSPGGWKFLPPMAMTTRLEYDFSILKAHIMRLLAACPEISIEERRILAIDVMKLAFEHLVGRMLLATKQDRSLEEAKTLVVSGGVAANKFLMRVLREMLGVRGFGDMKIVAPPIDMCTDNAAMIAWTGWEMYRAGWESGLDITALKKWSVDEGSQGGILGASGWMKRER